MVFISVKDYKIIVRLSRARYDSLLTEIGISESIVAEREREMITTMAKLIDLMYRRAMIQKRLKKLESELKAHEMEKFKLVEKIVKKIFEEGFENKEVEKEIVNVKDESNEEDSEECEEYPGQTPKKMKFQ